MADVLQTSVSGLLAFQRALATTSHNISNVNTDGYNRQRTDFATRYPQALGGFHLGSGVNVSNIQRMVDDARNASVRSHSSDYKQLEVFSSLTGRIDNLLADKSAGLSPALQGVFNAVQQVANDPASQTSRQVLLSESENLVSRFKFLDSRFAELDRDVNQQLRVHVDEINQFADGIAKLNREIAMASGTGSPPNDLLDKRDHLLGQLSERVQTRIVMQEDGSMNVSIGNGQALVVGHSTNKLVMTLNAFDKSRPEIAFQSGQSAVNITQSLKGGSVGGLLDFRYNVLDPARNELGQLAAAIAMEFNAQHELGLRFDTNPPSMGSGNFFSVAEPGVQARDSNSTTGSPAVSFLKDGVADQVGSDYQLTRSGDDWVLRRVSDGKTWKDADIEAHPDDGDRTVFRVDGLKIDLGDLEDDDNPLSTAEHRDSFLIQPYGSTVGRLALGIDRPEQIAAAVPLVTGEAVGPTGQTLNSGSGRISPVTVSAPGTLFPKDQPLRLEFVQGATPAESHFKVIGYDEDGNDEERGTIPFNPAQDVDGLTVTLPNEEIGDVDGWGMSFTLAGVPADGDTFTIGTNQDGRGDNGNMLRLGQLADKGSMVGGGSTFQEFYSSMVGDIGSVTMRANINRDAQHTLLNQAVAAREEVSGVNLDEEAANLMRFQQAYQAAAQSITIANSMFQTLLNAIGR